MDNFLKKHLESHPLAQARDAVKFLYQRSFGGGHMITDAASCRERTAAETALAQGTAPHELLGGGLGRLSLTTARDAGLSPSTAADMFIITANTHTPDSAAFHMALSEALPLPGWHDFTVRYKEAGCPSLHHSDAYRAAYRPAYRVVRSAFIAIVPLAAAIDRALMEQEFVTVAVDGPCGSGKSSLAGSLAELYSGNLFHTDDFFPQPHQRGDGRLDIPGGNLDHERLLEQVFIPLSLGHAVSAQKFSCSRMTLSAPAEYPIRRVNIVEGSYSLHPSFRAYADIKAFVSVSGGIQRSRILRRGDDYEVFRTLWIPLENKYFDACRVKNAADVIIDNEEDDR